MELPRSCSTRSLSCLTSGFRVARRRLHSRGQSITIQQIADTLNVAHVVEGSVRRDGDRVLITAQLVDAQTDTHLWSATFERELTDIFAIQREIATAIADQLQITLSVGQQTQLVAEATENTEAHEAYLRGRYFWNQRTEAGLRNAITEFQRAVALDPSYAEAYSGPRRFPSAGGRLHNDSRRRGLSHES